MPAGNAVQDGGGRAGHPRCLLRRVSPLVSVLARGVRCRSSSFVRVARSVALVAAVTESRHLAEAPLRRPLSLRQTPAAVGLPPMQHPRCPGSLRRPGLPPQPGAARWGWGWDPLLTGSLAVAPSLHMEGSGEPWPGCWGLTLQLLCGTSLVTSPSEKQVVTWCTSRGDREAARDKGQHVVVFENGNVTSTRQRRVSCSEARS